MPKELIAPRITERAAEFYRDNFATATGGAKFVLDAFPDLYTHTLVGLEGSFSPTELEHIIYVVSRMNRTPEYAGRNLQSEVRSYCFKNKIDSRRIEEKIEDLPPFACACLEIWAAAYALQVDPDLEDYTSALA